MREKILLGTVEAEESDRHIQEEFGELGNTCGDLHYPPLDTRIMLEGPIRTCDFESEGAVNGDTERNPYLAPGVYIFHRIIHKSRHGLKFLEGVNIDGVSVRICIGQPESKSIDWRGARKA